MNSAGFCATPGPNPIAIKTCSECGSERRQVGHITQCGGKRWVETESAQCIGVWLLACTTRVRQKGGKPNELDSGRTGNKGSRPDLQRLQDRLEDKSCGLEDPAGCALFRLFPQVARAISSTHSDDIQDYINAIRSNVCSICREDEDGRCETRREVACALDAYLLLVVDAIEECTGKSFDRVALTVQEGGLR